MTLTSPSFPRGLPKLRTEAEARSMIDVIRDASVWRAGQSSIGAAREDEHKRMVEFFAALNSFRTIALNAQKHTEITAIDKGISELLAGLEDVLSDAGITQAAWAAEIEGML
jgi:hypothetical protein